MRIQTSTSRGIYTYKSIEKRKVKGSVSLIGVCHDNTLINLCNSSDIEEAMADQYINYISDKLNEAEINNTGSNLVISLINLENKNMKHFNIIAYNRYGKYYVGLERNYLGVEGDLSLLNDMKRKAEEDGCVVTNLCSAIVDSNNKLVIKEISKANMHNIQYILTRCNLELKIKEYIEKYLGIKLESKLEYLSIQ